MQQLPSMAIVYDWVDTPSGGAEQVLLALHQAFPKAPLYTSHIVQSKARWVGSWQVYTTWLQRLPIWLRQQRFSMLLTPLAFEMLDLSAYDIVVSVTSATAKGVVTRPDQLHICYQLTPPRYLYSHQEQYSAGWMRYLLKPIFSYLCHWDQIAQRRPDVIIPISNLVSQRIGDTYQLESDPVLYPPVRDQQVRTTKPQNVPVLPERPFVVVISRLVKYKKIELVLAACQKLAVPLVIIGTGPAAAVLKRHPAGEVYWLSHQSDEVVQYILQKAAAVAMPAVEDFGIVSLEAAQAGVTPVIHHDSGVSEILPDGVASIQIRAETVEAVSAGIMKALKHPLKSQELKQTAQKYATTSYVQEWQKRVTQLWHHHSRHLRKDSYVSS